MQTAPDEPFDLKPGQRVTVANPWTQGHKKTGTICGMRSREDAFSKAMNHEYLVSFEHRPSPMWVSTYLVSKFQLTAAPTAQQENNNDQNRT